MADCIKCGSYTKHEGEFCRKCDLENDNSVKIIPEKTEPAELNGLSEKDYNYRYGMIKGRIAETLIQELFLSLGYKVFRYGMEKTIPGIIEFLKGVKSEVSTQIRHMPDFVIHDPKSKSFYFIEVKFRANEEFSSKDLPKNYPYPNTYIILVSKKHIKCLTIEEIMQGGEISPTSKNYLGSRKEFDLDKEVIKNFCDFAIKFFDKV